MGESALKTRASCTMGVQACMGLLKLVRLEDPVPSDESEQLEAYKLFLSGAGQITERLTIDIVVKAARQLGVSGGGCQGSRQSLERALCLDQRQAAPRYLEEEASRDGAVHHGQVGRAAQREPRQRAY